jgi:hypothetical protein
LNIIRNTNGLKAEINDIKYLSQVIEQNDYEEISTNLAYEILVKVIIKQDRLAEFELLGGLKFTERL